VISEELPAEYLVLHLSEYFDRLTKIILKHNGIVDKYIGDSIMAVWGSLQEDNDQVVNACLAALECQRALRALDIKWTSLEKPPLLTRIGIHTGAAIAGNIGSDERMDFTVTGRVVNIAKGLEGANKYYGTRILVSENAEIAAHDKILFRIIDKVAVKGCKPGILVFEPICTVPEESNEEYLANRKLCTRIEEAFTLYQAMHFEEALERYTDIVDSAPRMKSAIAPLIERCREFIANPPPKDWDGTNYLV
jgi:adenylate cyclase